MCSLGPLAPSIMTPYRNIIPPFAHTTTFLATLHLQIWYIYKRSLQIRISTPNQTCFLIHITGESECNGMVIGGQHPLFHATEWRGGFQVILRLIFLDFIGNWSPSFCCCCRWNCNLKLHRHSYKQKTNCNFNRAEEEFNNFESFKRNRYHQKWFGTSQRFSLVWGRKVNWKKYCGAITEKWKRVQILGHKLWRWWGVHPTSIGYTVWCWRLLALSSCRHGQW